MELNENDATDMALQNSQAYSDCLGAIVADLVYALDHPIVRWSGEEEAVRREIVLSEAENSSLFHPSLIENVVLNEAVALPIMVGSVVTFRLDSVSGPVAVL